MRRGQAFHRLLVSECPVLVRDLVRVAIKLLDGGDVAALSIGHGARCFGLLDRLPAGLERRRRRGPSEWVSERHHGHAPPGYAALRILGCNVAKRLVGWAEPEGV